MKKLIVALTLAATSTVALADPHWGGHHDGYYGGYHGGYRSYNNHYYHGGGYGYGDILVPMVIGGAIGYAINEANRQPQVIYQQPPVVYQSTPTPTVTYQKCTPWVESVDQYGVTTRTRTCY